MPNTFFISDTHFGHANILKFYPELRPGKDIGEHDEILIQLWNSVVKNPNDTVWHVGDFAIAGSYRISRIARRLLGIKKLVLGNHDRASQLRPFFKLYGVARFENHILSHMPVHPNNTGYKKDEKSRNIHGHLHAKNIMCEGVRDRAYVNVSCEQINCTPIEYSELQKRF